MAKLWEKEEDTIIREVYSMNGPAAAAEALSKAGYTRTIVSVKNRAQFLGLYFRQEYTSWSQAEIDILRDNYPTMGKKVMELLPTKSLKNIQVTAFRLGIKKAKIK